MTEPSDPVSEHPLPESAADARREEPPLEERLAALSALALALDADAGGPIGGFWPDAVWLEGDLLQTALDRTRPSAERFAERLSRTETLADVAFMAPEIAVDKDGAHGHAADAYSFAALVYVCATGRAPIGRLDVGKLQSVLGQRRFARILDGLSPDPLARPTLNELAHALKPTPERVAAAIGEAPPRIRGPVGTRAIDDDDTRAMVADEPKSFLRPLLMVGAVSVFVGALWFIWLAWGLLTDFPRLLLVVGFTAAVGWSSELLARNVFDEAAKTLRVLFTQLFWAVGGMVLVVTGTLKSELGWALVAFLVALVSVVVAVKRGPKSVLVTAAILSTLLALVLIYVDLGDWGRVVLFVGLSVLARLALFMGDGLRIDVRALVGTAHVFANAIAAAHATWALWPNGYIRVFSKHGVNEASPDHVVRFVAIVVVIAIAWGVSRHFTQQTKMSALTVLLNALLAVGLVPLITVSWHGGATCFAVVPPLVALVEVWIALRVKGETMATLPWLVFSSSLWLLGTAFLADIRWLTSLNVAIVGVGLWGLTVVLTRIDKSALLAFASTVHFAVAAMALGDHFSTGTTNGPSLWLFLTSVAYVVLGVVVLRFDDNLRTAHTAAGGFFAAGSTLLAVALLARDSTWTEAALFGAAFAYVPFAVCAPLLFDRKDSSRVLAAVAVLVLFALPGIELVVRAESFELSLLAAAAGLVGVALRVLVITPERAERSVGALADSFLMAFCVISGATTLAPSLIGAGFIIGRPLSSVVEHAMLVVLPLGALFGLGMGAERLERARAGRLLQLAATAVYLGVFTLSSFSEPQDYGHPALLFIGGIVLLALGTRTRHPHVVFLSSSALMLGFWTQFFMKLHSHAPMSVLLILFGVGILVGGVLYEKHVKALVTSVRSWPGL